MLHEQYSVFRHIFYWYFWFIMKVVPTGIALRWIVFYSQEVSLPLLLKTRAWYLNHSGDACASFKERPLKETWQKYLTFGSGKTMILGILNNNSVAISVIVSQEALPQTYINTGICQLKNKLFFSHIDTQYF